MAIKFQYNKTSLQQLNKELKIRVNALPTLQAKEAALRIEVKKARAEVDEVQKKLDRKKKDLSSTYRLWVEFPEGLIRVKEVDLSIKKIAGVKTPVYEKVEYELQPFSMFNLPSWIPQGIELLKQNAALEVQKEVAQKKVEILEYARKKTTQKVNLYEKVQIPEYQGAILKIKRFMEDEENLAKASQKILKERMARAEAQEEAA
ncbi:MAG: V-type ATP synthase subunit D [Chitinivibrionales bacterium]